MESVVHETILDERLGALEGARAWNPRVISKLESHIRTADDVALFRINPIRFAAEKNIAEAEAIDLFLHGAFLGLFEMDWLLLCSACSCVVESFGSLKGVRNQFHCAMCRTDLDAALDDYIAVAFTVSPQIRSITFHKPATLSAQDFAFAYKLTDEGLLPDGTPFVQMLRSWTSTVSYLPTGMTQLEVDAKEGLLHAWGRDTDAGFDFRVEGARPRHPKPSASATWVTAASQQRAPWRQAESYLRSRTTQVSKGFLASPPSLPRTYRSWKSLNSTSCPTCQAAACWRPRPFGTCSARKRSGRSRGSASGTSRCSSPT
ncbi:MAG: DUF5939 domain-containing protein [Microvirga sp.]|jgi:hypothetical protein